MARLIVYNARTGKWYTTNAKGKKVSTQPKAGDKIDLVFS